MDEFLKHVLFHMGGYSLSVAQVVSVAILIAGTWLFLQILQRAINRLRNFDEGQKYTTYTITKYFVYLIVISTALKLLGVDISVIVLSSAGLFVGIGLGLQSLFHDFISGIILLVEGTIKVGHVIQIDDKRVEVLEIRFRTSVVKTREEKEIIIPNSYLTKNEIINWSNQRNINRHYIDVQVSAKDVSRAMELMQGIVQQHRKVLAQPKPYVRIERFTDYAVELRVLFWSEEVYTVGRMLGEIRLMILNAFIDNNIQIPIPQQMVSIKDRDAKS